LEKKRERGKLELDVWAGRDEVSRGVCENKGRGRGNTGLKILG